MLIRHDNRIYSAGILIFAILGLGLAPGLTRAATITVTTLDDVSGVSCTLRDAIAAANTNAVVGACPAGAAGNDAIVFSPGLFPGAITLASALPTLIESATITGPGESDLTIDANGVDRIFNINAVGQAFRMSGMTLTGGLQDIGGAVSVFAASRVEFDHVFFVENEATQQGGGFFMNPDITVIVESCFFDFNDGSSGGGAIYHQAGDLFIRNSTFTNNFADAFGNVGHGGALMSTGGSATIENSTFALNSARESGGAIRTLGTTTIIRNSTITVNTADSDAANPGNPDLGGNGGGIYMSAISGSVTVINSIIADNIDNSPPALTLYHDVSNPFGGALTSSGFNFIGKCDGSCADWTGPQDQVGTIAAPLIPDLGMLGDNGGPTPTREPVSDIANVVDQGFCPGFLRDQRGFKDPGTLLRPVDLPVANAAGGDGCDIGAVERGAVELPVELVDFEGFVDGDDVVLRWSTASEKNNAGFAVEVRAQNAEFRAGWKEIGYVEGHGTTEQAQLYSYTASNLEPGTWHFRLMQIDYDGAFEYSSVVEVLVVPDADVSLTAAYPNPFSYSASVRVSVSTDQHLDVVVYDVLGREVSRLFDGLAAGGQTLSLALNAEDLPNGLYMIRATGERLAVERAIVVTAR